MFPKVHVQLFEIRISNFYKYYIRLPTLYNYNTVDTVSLTLFLHSLQSIEFKIHKQNASFYGWSTML